MKSASQFGFICLLVFLTQVIPIHAGADRGGKYGIMFGDSVSDNFLEIDVAHRELIELKVETTVGVEIAARAVAAYSGFECRVLPLQLIESRFWIVPIRWRPGADVSGCLLEITTDRGGRYFVKLSMRY